MYKDQLLCRISAVSNRTLVCECKNLFQAYLKSTRVEFCSSMPWYGRTYFNLKHQPMNHLKCQCLTRDSFKICSSRVRIALIGAFVTGVEPWKRQHCMHSRPLPLLWDSHRLCKRRHTVNLQKNRTKPVDVAVQERKVHLITSINLRIALIAKNSFVVETSQAKFSITRAFFSGQASVSGVQLLKERSTGTKNTQPHMRYGKVETTTTHLRLDPLR
jgi:hypothetical protein